MSVAVLSEVWSHSEASGSHLLVMLALADTANDEGFCWPSVEYGSRKARISTRTFLRALDELVVTGELEVWQYQSKGKGPVKNAYQIILGRFEKARGIIPGALKESLDRVLTESRRGNGIGDNMSHTPRRQDVAYIGDKVSLPARASLTGTIEAKSKAKPLAAAAVRKRTPRDDIWDALTAACGLDTTTLTAGERTRVGRSVNELVKVGASPLEISARATRYRRKYRGAALTDRALVNHWSEFGTPAAGKLGAYDG